MSLWIQINPGSSEAVYRQIVRQISQAVAKGTLSVGDKLPAVRKLAGDITVNPNTVAKAYSILEQLGVIVTRKGSGTFVNSQQTGDVDAIQINLLAERLDNVIAQAINLGLDEKAIEKLFGQRLKKFKK